ATTASGQRPVPGSAAPASAVASAAAGTGANPVTRKPRVNTALVKQGYRTSLRHGQLVYCRTEQLTGSRFKSELCMSESQVLDEQKRARELMTAPARTQCLGPECS